MGILSSVSNALGFSDEDAPKDAAKLQLKAVKKNIAFQKEALEDIRADLAPFREAGIPALNRVQSLISDPNVQQDFVQENPFFKFLADDAQDRLFNNAAARGKVGSGGTAKALQNSIMLLGNNLVDNQINREMGLVGIGENAAARSGNAIQNTSAQIGQSILGGGNAAASGIMGASNANTQGAGSVANLGLGIGALVALSDRRMKDHIIKVGDIGDVPIYLFKYKGDSKLQIGTMAQEVPDRAIDFGGKLYVDYRGL